MNTEEIEIGSIYVLVTSKTDHVQIFLIFSIISAFNRNLLLQYVLEDVHSIYIL